MPDWTKRRMQFRSGPQTLTFHACGRPGCRSALEAGHVLSFLPIRGEPAVPITGDEAADELCDICGEDND